MDIKQIERNMKMQASKASKASKTKFKRTLTIKISEWLRQTPNTNGDSFLRRKSDGKKCCLGFECRALGIVGISGLGDPAEVVNLLNSKEKQLDMVKKLGFLINKNQPKKRDAYGFGYDSFNYNDGTKIYYNSRDCNDLIKTNDNPMLSDLQKMQKIKSIFAKHKIKVKFVP